MNIVKLRVIIKREYSTRVKSKGFVIGTILTPLLMTSLLLLPVFLFSRGPRTDHRGVVLDQTRDVALYERAVGLLRESAKPDRFEIRREAVNEIQAENRRRELNKEIGEGKLDFYMVIPATVLAEGRIAYHAKNIGDFIAETRVENAFNTAVIEQRMIRSGLDVEQIGGLNRKIIMEKFNERGDGEDKLKIIMAFSLMGILCLTVLGYGGHIMSAVIEEKQSRIIELLVSSVDPFTLMLGKLVGVGLVGLTQYAAWAGFAVLLSGLAVAQSTALGSFRIPQISVSLMVFFVLYFLLGYFLYATLYVMVGGMVSSDDDGQQMQIPLMMLILLAPVASSFVWRQPDSVLATTLSLFPFFSPFSMFLRIAIHEPPLWQIAVSILLMIGTILGAVWLAAKLYRVGVLMYGKRPTLTEMAIWMRNS
jgi:ABC-2 type transport system permease protein